MRRSWIRKLFTPLVTGTNRKAPHLRLTLEDRCVPSTFTVINTLDDASVGTLRWAVGQANSNAGANTIAFDNTVFNTAKTITLAGSQLELSDTTGTETITGPAAGVTVNGGGLSRVFQVDGLVTASISGLTITGGNSGSSGGGVNNLGTATLSNCTVSGDSGGGAGGFISGGGGVNNFGSLAMNNCTVSGNSAYYLGGGVFNGYNATAALNNCTGSGNSAVLGGCMLNYRGTTSLTNCTVSANFAPFGSGGGLYSYGGPTTLGNTIVAGNTAQGGSDVVGVFNSRGNNLVGATDLSSGWIGSDLTGTGTRPLNPLLAPLGNYGGSTQTISLLPGSPAIDAGSNALIPTGVTTDQRGQPRILNGTVDIGAFESEGFTLSVVPGSSPQTATIGTPFAPPLAVKVTAINASEPVNGGIVRFTAHAAPNGASAFLLASSAVVSGSQAAVRAAPNNADGSYQVLASASGTAAFNLINLGPVFPSLVVNTTSDSLFPGAGLLSLREAVAFADADHLGNTKITFDKNVFAQAQTINLSGGQLELSNTSEAESITGPKAGVTVNSGGLSRVFQVDGQVIASISGLTITGGNSGNGGGVYNSGTLTLANCTVSGNSASSGGGVDNSGSLTLANCTVSGNSASSAGGGVSNNNGSKAALTNCTVSGNSAGGGGGGGVRNGGEFFGSLSMATLTNCTLSGNSASYGAGLYNARGMITLANCTVSGNSARCGGGGVFNFLAATATLTNCIVGGNSALGAGIFIGGGGVQNT